MPCLFGRELFSEAFFFAPKNDKVPDLNYAIDHIDVYEVEGKGKNRTQRLVIYYKFMGYLAIPETFSAPNDRADLRQGVAVEYVSCEPSITARELFGEDAAPVGEE